VLGLKAEMDLIFTLLTLDIRDPNMVYIFPLYQPFITPSLHYSTNPYGYPTPMAPKKPCY
jgi:hypothetical protein